MTHGLAFISYAFAALSGICFISGLAVIRGKEGKHNGRF